MRLLKFLIVVLALFALFCGRSLSLSGGSDTEVCGQIITAAGKGVSNARIELVPAQYDPAFDGPLGATMIDTTDSNGGYHLGGIRAGMYNLQAVHLNDGGRLLKSDIRVSSVDSVVVPADSLRRPAGLVVALPDGLSGKPGYVFIRGTTLYKKKTASERSVTFDSIPRGLLSKIEFKAGAADSSCILFSNVRTDTGSLIHLSPYAAWAHRAKVLINTSITGIVTTTNVVDFGLLVRLDTANFNFSQAQPGGADLRFADKNGNTLPYEIAKWDAATRQAAIWVGTDTLYANNDSQFVQMFWGNPAAQNYSSGAAVFDTARGYAGVWHLEEERGGVGTAGLYRDATPNAANGDDSVSSTNQDGFAGNGHGFSGKDKITTRGFVTDLVRGDLTIGVWVNLKAPGGVIFSKSVTGLVKDSAEDVFSFSDSTDVLSGGLRPTFRSLGNGFVRAEREMGLNQWHYYAFRRTYESGSASASSLFYIDGGFCGLTSTLTGKLADNPLDKVTIGSDGSHFLNGSLDELTISKVSRSSDWIMLSFENQRLDQGLVTVATVK